MKELLQLFNENAEVKNVFNMNESDYKFLKLTKYNYVNLIQINAPKKLNSMDFDLSREVLNVYKHKDDSKLYIFIGDEQNKYFCPGADLRTFLSAKENKGVFTAYGNINYYSLYNYYHNFTQNSIFIWNGVAMGSGFALGINSKYRIATDTTVLAMPESLFGFIANCNFSHFISSFLEVREALHMVIFGYRYSNYEAFLKGFATHFICNKYIPNVIEELKTIEDPVKKKNSIDNILKNYHDKSVNEYVGIEKAIQNIEKLNKLIEKIYDFNFERQYFLDFYENLKYNLKKNNLENLVKEFNKRSLHCLQCNYELTLDSYDDTLNYEIRINRDLLFCDEISKIGNLYEGIRAYFIEKDKLPHWRAKF